GASSQSARVLWDCCSGVMAGLVVADRSRQVALFHAAAQGCRLALTCRGKPALAAGGRLPPLAAAPQFTPEDISARKKPSAAETAAPARACGGRCAEAAALADLGGRHRR